MPAAASANSGDSEMAEPSAAKDPNKKELVLKSPFGSSPKIYGWPLKKGRGSLRKTEDKEDEAAEIVESIKYICEDHPEIREAMETSGLLSKTNPLSYDSMLLLCSTYNKAVDKLIKSTNSCVLDERRDRANRPHLKHILQQCYNKSVDDPNELNHYEPFTPEVYGETSFELICQILDKLHPISDDNKFIDLGSGVGQVVLQVAALTNCQISLGIEKAKAPSKFAREMKTNFEFWMSFYGKTYSKFDLVEGDFLDSKFRESILASTIIFVNNFAFGPEVDQRLKDIFADLSDGSRIFSSKSFCALNFRITERNLSDIGTIMHVSKMDPLKGSVSWTGKPVSYFLHIIDRAKLERYFQKSAARKEGEEHKRGRRSGRSSTAITAIDESSSGSRDDSRASSIEHDDTTRDSSQSGIRAWNTDPGTRNGSDEETRTSDRKSVASLSGGRRKGRKKIIKKKNQSSSDESMPQIDMSSGNVTDSNSSSPPPSELSSLSISTNSSRPMRAAVANAAAISVAQQDNGQPGMKGRGRQKKQSDSTSLPPPTGPGLTSGGRKKIVKNSGISSSAALDLLHKATMDSINSSNQDPSAPVGCVNVRLQIDHHPEMKHEELPVSLNTDNQGREIPIELRMFLEKIKKEYLTYIERMQTQAYRGEVEKDIAQENRKKTELVKREKQLKSQIDNLIADSLALLKRRLDELGIQAKTPPEFIEKAKMIVCNHHELQRNKAGLEAEIAKLEQAQSQVVAKKERELIDFGIRDGLTQAEAKAQAKRKIDSILNNFTNNNNNSKTGIRENKDPAILGLSSEVIVTKCSADQLPISTQIRKRPRDAIGKQKDWPEKRHKDSPATVSPIKAIPVGGDYSSDKMDEKSPTALAKKIIEESRHMERNKTLMSPPMRGISQSVEVRRIEAPLPPHPQQPSSSTSYKQQQQHDPTRYEHRQMPPHPLHQKPGGRSDVVDLPKMEMNMSLVSSGIGPMPVESPLVLPPHPPSRSASSDPNDDVTFSSLKMSTTPRAEQFEIRLKNIIQSVLAGDEQEGGPTPPPISLTTRSSSSPPPQQRPMFSPVKKELPSHLPLPPSGVVMSSQQYHQRDRPTDLSAYPQTSSTRTMNDLIASEIEKSLSGNSAPGNVNPNKPYHTDFRGGPFSGLPGTVPSSASAAAGGSRMSQVIEESIRGNFDRRPPPAAAKELEGLACPRSKSPFGSRSESSGRSNGDRGHEFPVEGLAARFAPQRSYWQPPQEGQPVYGRGYPGNPYPDGYPRKRSPPPQMSPVLPPKKQHFDHPDFRGSKDVPETSQQKWQDEISTGFDRLVAYATEVDKRRRSTDDSNSPNQTDEARGIKMEPFVDNRMTTLSMKFKGGYQQRPQATTYGSSNRAVASIPSPDEFENSSSSDPFQRQTSSRSPLPGENLPEHHFKKRYFAETRDFVKTENTTSSSSYSISPVHNTAGSGLGKKRADEFRGPSPQRNSSRSSASSHTRDTEEQRKTNSPALDSTTMP